MTTAILPTQPTSAPYTYTRHGERLRVEHASGLHRDYYVTADTIPAARLAVDFRAVVMHLLGHPSTRPEDRVAAGRAVIALDMVDAECVCGGYLVWGPAGRWMHLDLCQWCVDDPEACSLGHEVKRMCATPAPVQCGHNCHAQSSYTETRACGAGKDCCGRHGCDTAVAA